MASRVCRSRWDKEPYMYFAISCKCRALPRQGSWLQRQPPLCELFESLGPRSPTLACHFSPCTVDLSTVSTCFIPLLNLLIPCKQKQIKLLWFFNYIIDHLIEIIARTYGPVLRFINILAMFIRAEPRLRPYFRDISCGLKLGAVCIHIVRVGLRDNHKPVE